MLQFWKIQFAILTNTGLVLIYTIYDADYCSFEIVFKIFGNLLAKHIIAMAQHLKKTFKTF